MKNIYFNAVNHCLIAAGNRPCRRVYASFYLCPSSQSYAKIDTENGEKAQCTKKSVDWKNAVAGQVKSAAAWDLQASYILNRYNLNPYSVQSIGGNVEVGRCSLLSKCSGEFNFFPFFVIYIHFDIRINGFHYCSLLTNKDQRAFCTPQYPQRHSLPIQSKVLTSVQTRENKEAQLLYKWWEIR